MNAMVVQALSHRLGKKIRIPLIKRSTINDRTNSFMTHGRRLLMEEHAQHFIEMDIEWTE